MWSVLDMPKFSGKNKMAFSCLTTFKEIDVFSLIHIV